MNMSLVSQINYMVEQLREPEQLVVFEVVRRFLPDDVATLEDLNDIAAAREEYCRGETFSDSDIDWN
jgi:hypothetical protein